MSCEWFLPRRPMSRPPVRAGMQPLRGFGRDPQMRGSNRGCITLTARGESILATT